MAVKIALAQTTSGEKWEVNLRKAWEYAEEASRQKAEMIVFPEYFMTYYPMEEGDYQKQGQSLEGEFVREMGRAARETGLWMVFGVNETGKDRNYNTIVILDAEGQLREITGKHICLTPTAGKSQTIPWQEMRFFVRWTLLPGK